MFSNKLYLFEATCSFIAIISVVMVSVIMQRDIMQSVIALNVILLSVVAPNYLTSTSNRLKKRKRGAR